MPREICHGLIPHLSQGLCKHKVWNASKIAARWKDSWRKLHVMVQSVQRILNLLKNWAHYTLHATNDWQLSKADSVNAPATVRWASQGFKEPYNPVFCFLYSPMYITMLKFCNVAERSRQICKNKQAYRTKVCLAGFAKITIVPVALFLRSNAKCFQATRHAMHRVAKEIMRPSRD